MRILTRKPGEFPMIGDDICAMSADPKNIQDRSVRIGIDAPEYVHTVREALIERRPTKPQDDE